MYWQKRFDRIDPNKELEDRVLTIHKEHKDFGYRRMQAVLRKEGIHVNKKKVQRIMQKYGIQVTSYTRKSRRYSSYKGNVGRIAPNRIHRRFHTTVPHQKITTDVFFLFLDILLLVLFGTALSSIINFFLSTQGQISAVGTIISAGYGFICGAYMPISSFGEGLQKIISFLPGTYGTSLIRNHTMQGALAEMQNQGIPAEVIEKLKDSLDCNLYFFGSQVNIGAMYMILGITILVLIGVYILLNKSKKYNYSFNSCK